MSGGKLLLRVGDEAWTCRQHNNVRSQPEVTLLTALGSKDSCAVVKTQLT